jgi:hypothetical protein
LFTGGKRGIIGLLQRRGGKDPMHLNIAMDGPVGSGKSSVADAVAARLGILHLDTGAMYRALGLKALRAGIDTGREPEIVALCDELNLEVRVGGSGQRTMLDGEDVSGLFYDSFADLQEEVHRIVACAADTAIAEDGGVLVSARSFQNADITPQYRLMAVLPDRTYRELHSWQEDAQFHVERTALEGAVSFRLEVRQKGMDVYDAWQEDIPIP